MKDIPTAFEFDLHYLYCEGFFAVLLLLFCLCFFFPTKFVVSQYFPLYQCTKKEEVVKPHFLLRIKSCVLILFHAK